MRMIELPDESFAGLGPVGPRKSIVLRAASALALYDPDSPRWEVYSLRIARILVNVNPLDLDRWVNALRPVLGKTTMFASFKAISSDANSSRLEQILATVVGGSSSGPIFFLIGD